MTSAQADGSAPVPVCLLTGWLGAGKTTLLNAVLKQPGFGATAVVVNEFGDVGIDHRLVEAVEGDLMVLATGCLCCAAHGDLAVALAGLLRRRRAGSPSFDRIVVEASGLADPGPILNALFLDPAVGGSCRLDTVLCLVDAVAGAATLDRYDAAMRQVAVADRIVLTKTDLLGLEDAVRSAALRARLAELNPRAPTGDAATATDLGAALFDPHRAVQRAPRRGFLATAAGHASVRSCCLEAGAIDLDRLDAFLAVLGRRHGAHLLRLKGLVAIRQDPDRPLVVHMVGHRLHPATRLPAWPPGPRLTQLVVIVDGIATAGISELWDGFFGGPAIDRPDAAALSLGVDGGGGLFA